MELTEIMRRRRMTRNFGPEPVPPEVVDELLEGALRAPSAGNTQGRELLVLEGVSETAVFWETVTDARWRGRSRRYRGLARAPVIVLVFADPAAYASRYAEPDKVLSGAKVSEWSVPYWFVDASFATMAILLGATDRGLGAAFLGNFRGEDGLRSALSVPEHVRWLGAVLIGHPDQPDPPSSSLGRPRRTVADSVHRGRWRGSDPGA
ncbi:MAG: nitroreductase family protein [Acidimicrobiales bacterium]